MDPGLFPVADLRVFEVSVSYLFLGTFILSILLFSAEVLFSIIPDHYNACYLLAIDTVYIHEFINACVSFLILNETGVYIVLCYSNHFSSTSLINAFTFIQPLLSMAKTFSLTFRRSHFDGCIKGNSVSPRNTLTCFIFIVTCLFCLDCPHKWLKWLTLVSQLFPLPWLPHQYK